MRDRNIRGDGLGVAVVAGRGATATATTADAGISTAAGGTSSTLLSGLATVAIAAGGAVAESWGRVSVEMVAMVGMLDGKHTGLVAGGHVLATARALSGGLGGSDAIGVALSSVGRGLLDDLSRGGGSGVILHVVA